MKGLTKTPVQTLVTAVIASSLLMFSAGAFSSEKPAENSAEISVEKKTAEAKSVSAQKPAHNQSTHNQTAPVAGSINLNKADVKTLAQLNGVGEKKAEAIIAYRESNGGFKSVNDLVKVKGIGEKILDKNRTLLSVD